MQGAVMIVASCGNCSTLLGLRCQEKHSVLEYRCCV